ncbi:GGDEF domain-containing protein [Paenibacillus glucanolyticus]|uniref:GGDEF domain-containing protein n=1 Tax=Paenibacillus TaxID=44249 RepID=UPI0004AD2B0F|nr:MULTISPECIES: GGDEF domain-containing protein [Paenibacillus]ANA83375.1 diguanylate cyclase [Paenibacillus glucanolyticus]AVV60112.1 GGDEF domain-containing protein [Paenibacillus glucanolyticus]MPY19311.1 GGDEF domain-containing protein [Paenibacillus glucanolyticus]OMF79427.1 GGDEF domain-containing protein [Paenibacillus glucanolyticus]
MENKRWVQRAVGGYALLIGLAVLQELLVYINVFRDQSFTLLELGFAIGCLAALMLGFLAPAGVSVVCIFVYIVAYFVWLTTYAKVDVLSISWLWLLPANVAVAAFIKTGLVRNKRLMERLEELQRKNPEVDLATALGNKEAFRETLIKQSNLANRYSDTYNFCLVMFKIEFLPMVQESLGSQGYAQLLASLSEGIRKHIRYEDYKFALDRGRFIVLLPMTDQEYLMTLTDRIRHALVDIPSQDGKGGELNLVIRAGALVFAKEQFSQYEDADAVIAALERNTETDLIGEYI